MAETPATLPDMEKAPAVDWLPLNCRLIGKALVFAVVVPWKPPVGLNWPLKDCLTAP